MSRKKDADQTDPKDKRELGDISELMDTKCEAKNTDPVTIDDVITDWPHNND